MRALTHTEERDSVWTARERGERNNKKEREREIKGSKEQRQEDQESH
jgi:hypothetical protein